MTTEEMTADNFKAVFVDNLKYRYPESRYPQIGILPDFCDRIREIELKCGARRSNVSTYINNLLERHFEDYETQINELLNPNKND